MATPLQRPHLRHFSRIRSQAMVKKGESHVHPWHELVMILSGEYSAECDGRTIFSRPGTVLYYGMGHRHAWRTQRTELIEYYLLQFDGPPVRAQTALPFSVADSSGQLLSLFRRLEELCAAPQREVADAYLEVILHEFQRAAKQAEGEWLANVRSFIYSRLDRPIRLSDLARVARLSPFHFSRAFKRKTGVTPMRYLKELRAEAALPLLRGTDLPHKVIAREIGLANERDLYRLFMDVKGKAPSLLRDARELNVK